MKLKSHAGALRAAQLCGQHSFVLRSLLRNELPSLKTLCRSNHLHFATAGNFCCAPRDPRWGISTSSGLWWGLDEGTSGTAIPGSPGRKLHPPPAFLRVANGFCRSQQQIPGSLSAPRPSPPAQHPSRSPVWELKHLATFAGKHVPQRQDSPPLQPPTTSPRSRNPPLQCLLLKAEVKPLGYLEAGLDLGSSRWQRRGGAGPEPDPGRSLGGYLGAEGGEAGEPGGAGSHTSHRRSAGEVADLTAAFNARTCPRV